MKWEDWLAQLKVNLHLAGDTVKTTIIEYYREGKTPEETTEYIRRKYGNLYTIKSHSAKGQM